MQFDTATFIGQNEPPPFGFQYRTTTGIYFKHLLHVVILIHDLSIVQHEVETYRHQS